MAEFRYGVRVMPRDVILDTQGRAVEQILLDQKFPVKMARVGKFVELALEGTESDCLDKVKSIAQNLLCNPLIEKFEIVKME